MNQRFEGQLVGTGLRIAIAVSRFNGALSEELLTGAQDSLRRHGVADGDVDVARVPGAMELPMVAMKLARSGRYDAIICLGVVIRGSTPHFDYVAGQSASGIAQVALQTGVPTAFGVVTTENIEQAIERCGTKAGNKGADAAMTAIEMASLLKAIPD